MIFGRVHLKKHLPVSSMTRTAVPLFPVKIHGKDRISSFTPISPSYFYSCIKNLDGCYYFAAMGRSSVNRDPWIYKYNPVTNSIVQEFRVQMGTVTEDSHRVATIDNDSSGNIFVCAELLRTDVEAHSSPIKVYKTTTPYDISTLTLFYTSPGRYTYPWIEIQGSNIFLAGRGSTLSTFVRHQYAYLLSTDSGANFGTAVTVYDSGDPLNVAYMGRITSNDGFVYLILNERDNAESNWTFVSIIKGTIGSNIWTNVQGTFSKNVLTSGAITRAEMIANCLVYESPDYDTIAVNCDGGVVKSNGDIKMVIITQTYTGEVYVGNPQTELLELRFYVFSGGVWSYNVIDVTPGAVFYWAYERFYQIMQNNEAFDDVLEIDQTTRALTVHRSTDNFATQTSKLQLPGDGMYRLGTFAYNAQTEEDYFLALVSTPGDIFTIYDETVNDYSNLVTFKNFDIE